MTGTQDDAPDAGSIDPQAPTPDAPDVLTFPPVIFAIFYAIGYLTDLAFPLVVGPPSLRYAIGGVLIAIGVGIAAWAIYHFQKARTHVDIRKPATALVSQGPYRLSRNPMYLALTLLYAGLAIGFSLPVTLVLLIPCIAVLHHGVIRREEIYLDRKFGDAYRAYTNKVRRWL